MSKYQALIDALAGVDGQLGQPSLHSGHVIYAETEEWCSVDINIKLSANRHISGPLARFIKEAANPATIRALLADLERAEKALAALAQQAQEPVAYMDDDVAAGVLAGSVLLSAAIRGAPGGTFNFPLYTRPQQAQEPWGWAIEDKHGVAQAIRPARKEFFGCIQATEPFTVEDVEKMGREWPGLAPHRIVNLYTTPPAPQPAPVDERAEFERWCGPFSELRRSDFDPGRYCHSGVSLAWDAWQARAALQSPAPQTKGQP